MGLQTLFLDGGMTASSYRALEGYIPRRAVWKGKDWGNVNSV